MLSITVSLLPYVIAAVDDLVQIDRSAAATGFSDDFLMYDMLSLDVEGQGWTDTKAPYAVDRSQQPRPVCQIGERDMAPDQFRSTVKISPESRGDGKPEAQDGVNGEYYTKILKRSS